MESSPFPVGSGAAHPEPLCHFLAETHESLWRSVRMLAVYWGIWALSGVDFHGPAVTGKWDQNRLETRG